MSITRKAIELGLSVRAENGIKVRQPLASATIEIEEKNLDPQYIELIQEELNVKVYNADHFMIKQFVKK